MDGRRAGLGRGGQRKGCLRARWGCARLGVVPATGEGLREPVQGLGPVRAEPAGLLGVARSLLVVVMTGQRACSQSSARSAQDWTGGTRRRCCAAALGWDRDSRRGSRLSATSARACVHFDSFKWAAARLQYRAATSLEASARAGVARRSVRSVGAGGTEVSETVQEINRSTVVHPRVNSRM